MVSPEGFSIENIEKPKWHYVYSNNEIPGHPVVFECDAENPAKADGLYEEKIGKKPDKEYIACSVVKN
jgi:hypothetical protein